jgi:hypothetical protein
MQNQDDQDLMDYLLELGTLTPQQEQAMRQQKQVELLRQGSEMPQMRNAGRMVQAANPLEFLNSAARTGAAEYKQRGADAAMDKYGAARRGALDNMLGKRNARTAAPGIVPPAGGGSPYGDDPYAVGGW